MRSEKKKNWGKEVMRESQDIEFKEKWKDEHLKTLCSFANGDGGILYVGIRDDGTPVEIESPEKLLETLPNKIRNNLGVKCLFFVDTIIIKGNLFVQVEALTNAIKKHINVSYVIEDVHRKDVWDYPLPAIREACINALIHRDYMDSAEIQIKIYDGPIWFWNPGGLPEGLTIDDLKKEHPSKSKNKLLAMVFYYAGLIVKMGYRNKKNGRPLQKTRSS
ncbi:hypothetical protein JCM12298_28020 [Desulfothermus naphthae]